LANAGAITDQQGEQPWEIRHVTGDQHGSRFIRQPITNPLRRVVWQQSAFGGDRRERIARLPVRFRGLTRA